MATVETPNPPSPTKTPDTPPVLPRPASAAGRPSEALSELRRFHFGAPGAAGREPLGDDYTPAVLLAAADEPGATYPLFLGPPGEGATCLALADLVTRAGAEPASEITRELARLAAGEPDPVDAHRFLERLSGPSSEALKAAIPAGGRFLPMSGDAPIELLRLASESRVKSARIAFRAEVRALAGQAAARLPGRRESGAEPSGSALGALGNRFIDPGALAGVLKPKRDEPGVETAGRLAEDLDLLEWYLSTKGAAEFFLVRDGGLDEAAGVFDREAASVAGVVRAVRRLRLAVAGHYEPERHDPWLDRLDWRAFTRDELRLLPAVAAVVSADEVAVGGMAPLSRLLLSGRPIQVLVTVDPQSDPGAEPFAAYRFEPAYLGLSHREVLVQQTTAARPAHMMRGFLRAVDATHAGLHVISTSAADHSAVEARALPLFHYDPEAGSDWAERLDFAFNPSPEADWPVRDLAVAKEGGGEDVLKLAFTFADYALLEPAYAAHFHPVPDEVPEGDLVPMADHCAAPADAVASAIPFVWAVDRASRLRRLAVSRPLALACRDRLDFWRTLQGIAGVRSEHVRRAAETTRKEADARALEERQRLERMHAEELERLRETAARDVVDRLTSALLEVDPAELVAAPAAGTPAAGTPAAPIGGFQGRSIEEVTAALLALVDPATLDEERRGAGDERVERMASELLRAL